MLWNHLSLPFRFNQPMQITQIYLTDNNHDPSGLLARCCQSAKRAFSFVPHRLYKNDDIELLIRKNFDDRVLESYQKLIPYAYKSDLARLCILFCHSYVSHIVYAFGSRNYGFLLYLRSDAVFVGQSLHQKE